MLQLISNDRKYSAGLGIWAAILIARDAEDKNGWCRNSWSCKGQSMTTRDKILVFRNWQAFAHFLSRVRIVTLTFPEASGLLLPHN